MAERYDVGVVGYGATGGVLVDLLVNRGMSVVVFDKWPGVLEIPRAAHFDDETMRTMQTLEVLKYMPGSIMPTTDYGIFNAFDQRVTGFASMSDEPTDQGWLSDYFFNQPEIEHYLRGRAIKNGVAVKLHCEVVDLEERDGGVLITYKDAGVVSHQPQTVLVRYVVGADGSGSFVRKYLGIEMEELAPDQRWMICDIRVHDNINATFSNDSWTKVTPEETITFVAMPKNMKRFEISMAEHLTDSDVKSPEAIETFLSRWVKPGDYDILRAHVYHFHALVAKSWGNGRILIAGDAAHTTPPFLGQGVCAGIRDAQNLAWKLARVVKGNSSDTLLDTYQSERWPHAYALVKIAGDVGVKLKWMANATPEELEAMRQEEYQHIQVRPLLGPGLHADGAKAGGSLSPQPRLADGNLLDDRVGYDFALVGDPAVISGMSPETRASLREMGAVIVPDESETVRDAVSRLGGAIMLIRPDRYLIGIADTASETDALVADLSRSLR